MSRLTARSKAKQMPHHPGIPVLASPPHIGSQGASRAPKAIAQPLRATKCLCLLHSGGHAPASFEASAASGGTVPPPPDPPTTGADAPPAPTAAAAAAASAMAVHESPSTLNAYQCIGLLLRGMITNALSTRGEDFSACQGYPRHHR